MTRIFISLIGCPRHDFLLKVKKIADGFKRIPDERFDNTADIKISLIPDECIQIDVSKASSDQDFGTSSQWAHVYTDFPLNSGEWVEIKAVLTEILECDIIVDPIRTFVKGKAFSSTQ